MQKKNKPHKDREKMEEKMIMSIRDKDNNYKDDDEEEEEVLLPGFRFHPTDEELVGFYLRRKVEKKPLSIELIKQVDIYKYDPWDLPKVGMVGEKEWYFFCRRGRKYRNSIRPNRVAESGFWKATGIDKPIFGTSTSHDQETHACIGLKKSLVYYIGSAGKGTKTEWMMHEFRLPPTWKNTNQQINAKNKDITLEAEVWTLCRILKRNASFRKYTPPYRKQDTSEQITKDGSPISFSLESDENMNSRNLQFQQKREKLDTNHVEERNIKFRNQQNSTAQTPFTASQLSYGNPNKDEFGGGNWDDLRTVVELAIDPFSLNQFR